MRLNGVTLMISLSSCTEQGYNELNWSLATAHYILFGLFYLLAEGVLYTCVRFLNYFLTDVGGQSVQQTVDVRTVTVCNIVCMQHCSAALSPTHPMPWPAPTACSTVQCFSWPVSRATTTLTTPRSPRPHAWPISCGTTLTYLPAHVRTNHWLGCWTKRENQLDLILHVYNFAIIHHVWLYYHIAN